MTEIFPICKLGKVASVKSGFAFRSKDMGTEGSPVIKIGNINPPNVDIYNVERVPFDIINSDVRIKKFLLEEGDTLVAMTGATVGKLGRFPKTNEPYYLNQRVGKLFLNKPEEANYDFLYYVLSQKKYVEQIFSSADGSAQANVSGGQIEAFKIPLPSLIDQKAIASVLGTLDNKIENNRQMNKTLEKMARATFKSWFVDFDPVHAKAAGNSPAHMDTKTAALFPSSFGKDGLPVSWNNLALGDVLTIKRGGSPRPINDFFATQGLPWTKISDATASESPFIFSTKQFIKPEGLAKTVLLQKGDLILSNSATPGIPKFLDIEACIHDGWLYFTESKLFSKNYLYLLFLTLRKIFISQGNGSVFTNLKTDIVKNQLVNIPNQSVLKAFDQLIEPLFDCILNNSRNSITLGELRDTLLPKLISGEIRVKDAERKVESAL